jgi:predicted ATPase/class 3 adenylate cyclase
MTSSSDLPTGTVTFLFTDIEGSTRLLQRLGEGYRAVQDRHADLLRTAARAERGHEVRTEGDSFFFTFASPAGAVRAAVTAQRALHGEEWPHGDGLRVRMGLHTGEGVAGGDDYLGMDVNRAARIAAAGHGGQVLVSDSTRALVEQSLPEGVTLRDLGRHRLKDLDHPERLFDLVIRGLPTDFPPIRSLDARPTNLPPQRTSFVGRERELTEVPDLLGRSRLVTLTGPGGTGKTRLALGVAGNAMQRFRDGVFVVDLSAVTDPTVVPAAIATALAVREDPAADRVRTLTDHLRDRELLLVLDNMEQVIEAADTVDRILDAAPALRVLATSRVPLRLSGEHEYRVDPLPLPDPVRAGEPEALGTCESVMLFLERASAVRGGFRLTDDNATAIAGIVERVDGLPLAIELAASRVKALSPEALFERLEQRLPLLGGGPRDLPARQQTLRDTIRWSHDLLDEEERRLFARLSVFSGGFALEAAEALCAPGLALDVMDGIGALVDHSLVRRQETGDGRVRYRMLETIREFALERLDESSDADEVRRRHAWHVVAMVEEAEPKLLTERAQLDRIEEEHDNVRAALRWSIGRGQAEPGLRIAGAVWRFWQVRSHLAEGRRWTEELLTLPDAAARTPARAKALGALGSLTYYMREPDHVRGPYEESLGISRELGDQRGQAEGAYNLAWVHVLKGDLAGAKDLLLEARDIFRRLDEPVRVAHASTALAQAIADEGDLDRAEPLIEEARATFQAHGELWGVTFTSGQLGAIRLQRGDHDGARRAVWRSLEASEAMNARGWSAVALKGLAILAIREGDPDRGIRLAGAANRANELAGYEAPPSIVGLEDPLELVKGSLPHRRIDALWEEGRAMSFEQALQLARRDT